MGYTYDEFVNSATKAGMLDRFSQEDLTAAQKNPEYGLSMLSLMQDASGAKTTEQRILATEAANQLRKNYGVYSNGGTYAGSYGTKIDGLMDQVNNYGSFQYGQQGQLDKTMDQVNNYGSFKYSQQDALDQAMDQVNNYGAFQYGNENAYQKLLDEILNREEYSYDYTQDPTYSAYRKAYLREGERAGANALAQAAAASGGRASSYALTAAQQAQNYYAGQLADIIPTLEQQAYSRYQTDYSNLLNDLGVLQTDRAQAKDDWQSQYTMLQNTLANLQNDRAMEQSDWQSQYELLLNALSNLQNDRAFDYQSYLDQYSQLQQALGNFQNQDATDYERYLAQQQLQQEQEQTAYERALDQYQILGYITPEMSAILGIPATEKTEETTTYDPGSPAPQEEDPTGEEPEDEIIGNDTMAQLLAMYPGGAVSDAATWSYLTAIYDETALNAAGLYYRQKQPAATGAAGKINVNKTPVALS